MGLLKKIGKGLGGVLKGVSPLLGMVPGVGTLGGAGAGALGSLLSGGNMGDHLGAAAGGATGGLLKRIGGGGLPDTVPAPDIDISGSLTGGAKDLYNRITPLVPPEDGSFGGRLKRVVGGGLGAIRENPDLALAAASGLSGALSARTADKRLKSLDADARRRYDQGAALFAQDGPVDTQDYIYRRR